jgi:hypothetical protein
MTVEVKQILKPTQVETAEDEMPDRLKSSDISSEIDFLKRIKLKAQILASANALASAAPQYKIPDEDVVAASFESQEDKRKKKFYSKLIALYNKTTITGTTAVPLSAAQQAEKLSAKKDLAYLYSVYGMKDLYELACDLSKIERTSETNAEATTVSKSILDV